MVEFPMLVRLHPDFDRNKMADVLQAIYPTEFCRKKLSDFYSNFYAACFRWGDNTSVIVQVMVWHRAKAKVTDAHMLHRALIK